MLIVWWLLANCFLPRNFLHVNLAKVNSRSMWHENTSIKYVLVFFGGAFLEGLFWKIWKQVIVAVSIGNGGRPGHMCLRS